MQQDEVLNDAVGAMDVTLRRSLARRERTGVSFL
jgi:hypothetical protein